MVAQLKAAPAQVGAAGGAVVRQLDPKQLRAMQATLKRNSPSAVVQRAAAAVAGAGAGGPAPASGRKGPARGGWTKRKFGRGYILERRR